tara:strand:- start:385 stop:726 length:342 start_codon:yes stop_codon:yes gene_type:complete
MNSFPKTNRNLFTYSLIFLLILPIFGFKFLLGFIGNILLLLFLIPLLLLLILFIGFNTFKSKVMNCEQCGEISLGLTNKCMNCGADLENNNIKQDITNNPSERTIEVKAEEIK